MTAPSDVVLPEGWRLRHSDGPYFSVGSVLLDKDDEPPVYVSPASEFPVQVGGGADAMTIEEAEHLARRLTEAVAIARQILTTPTTDPKD